MPNWDEDSPQLRENLARVLEEIVQAAEQRETPTLEAARRWQTIVMQHLDVPDSRFVGAFRGEPGVENVQVSVGANYGVDSAKVAEELKRFEAKVQTLAAELDALPIGQEPDADQLAAIVDLCAWSHAEWVRIHPFANGNGRTARLWANGLAMRYGLPPFIRLRPRPDAGYGDASAKAMQGGWEPTAVAFRRLLEDFLNDL
ncbi:MAG: Fic family protein [Candidatus Sulfotelmatobacter sp.]